MLELLDMPLRFRLQEILDSQTPPLSQRELARLSGVSLVTINAIANNRTRQVALDTLDKIAAALGVDAGDLLVRDRKGKRG
jgi:DNA-binding Xre family transcriptional regulator